MGPLIERVVGPLAELLFALERWLAWLAGRIEARRDRP
jgi:hypothetical protein